MIASAPSPLDATRRSRRRPVRSAIAPQTGANTIFPVKYAAITRLTANGESRRPTMTAIAVPISTPFPKRSAVEIAIITCWPVTDGNQASLTRWR